MSEFKTNSDEEKPLYKQVVDIILEKIDNQIYQPGEAIPTERKLAEELEISRYTVRKAIKNLVKKGYLYTVQGSGTFVFEDQNQKVKDSDKFIGVSLSFSDRELDSKILSGIEEKLNELDYSMLYMNSKNNYKKEAQNIQKMKSSNVAGLIIMPAENEEGNKMISELKEENFPFVLVDRKLKNCETDCVISDNIKGGYEGTEYLIKLGHKKIAFVKKEFSKTSTIKDRIKGYKSAIEDYDLDYDPSLILSYNLEESDDKNSLTELKKLILENKITAILAKDAEIALKIVKFCKKENIKIPQELSLITFDDSDIIKHIEPPLTSIAQFPREIGKNAAELITKKINQNEKSLIKQFYCPVELIIRDSCAPPSDK